MDHNQALHDRPQGSSTVSTTTIHGPHTPTTTHSTSPGQGTSVTHFGTQSTTYTHPTTTTTTRMPVLQAPAPVADPVRPNSQSDYSGSIRIRRPTSRDALPVQSPQSQQPVVEDYFGTGRRRSSSEPRPPSAALFTEDNDLRRHVTAAHLQPVYEDGVQPTASAVAPPPAQGHSTKRKGMDRQMSALNIRRNNNHLLGHNHKLHGKQNANRNRNNMDANVVDVLDVIGQYLLCDLTCYANIVVQILRFLRLQH
jgi:hypothetical protein